MFSRPAEICKTFNLKVAKEGRWAGRLIIPLTIGWTGRAMRSHIEPRYLSHTSEDGFFLYKQHATCCIILEGAIDCMRVVSVTNQFDVIGKCGNRLSSALLNYLKQANYLSILNIPDGDVAFLQAFQETKILTGLCTKSVVKKIKIPDGIKDLGEFPESDARRWLTTLY
jgi:hypothetical protein